MAVKVYINTAGNAVIVDDGASPVNVIRLDSFFYEKDESKDYVTIRDTDDDYSKRVKPADVTDEAGTPYGTIEDVVDFFNTIYDLSIAQPLPAGAATEATLLSILNNMIASQDNEILLVADDGNLGQIVQQIREYDQGTGVWTTRYEDVNGVAYVPVGPLRYLDASAVLNLILTELQAQGLTLNDIDANTDGLEALLTTIDADTSNLDVPLSTVAKEATLELVRLLLVSLDGKDFATELTLSGIKTQTDLLNFIATALEVNVTSSVLPTGAATEATLATLATEAKLEQVRALLATIDADTSNLDVALSTIATEATLELCRLLLVDLKVNTTDVATQTTLAAVLAELQGVLDVTFTNTSIEVTQGLHDNLNANANLQVENVDVSGTNPVPVTYPTGVNSAFYSLKGDEDIVSVGGHISLSIQNLGSTTITFNGQGIPPGVSVSWDAAEGKTLTAYNIMSGGPGTSYAVATVS